MRLPPDGFRLIGADDLLDIRPAQLAGPVPERAYWTQRYMSERNDASKCLLRI